MERSLLKSVLVLLSVVVVVLSLGADGAVYVSSSSSCTTGCGSQGSPFKTIVQGIGAVSPAGGDVILLPGTYSGPGNLNLQISSSGPITIESSTHNPSDVIIDCAGFGPGVAIQSTGPVTLIGMTIQNCHRVNNSGSSFPTACGGAVRITSVNTIATLMRFIDNSATDGGAVCIYSATVTANSCYFQGNTGSSHGGAVYIQSASVSISNSSFGGNSAGGSGNNVYCQSASITIDNLTNLGGNGNTDCVSCPITLIDGNTRRDVCASAGMIRTTFNSLVMIALSLVIALFILDKSY